MSRIGCRNLVASCIVALNNAACFVQYSSFGATRLSSTPPPVSNWNQWGAVVCRRDKCQCPPRNCCCSSLAQYSAMLEAKAEDQTPAANDKKDDDAAATKGRR